MKKVLGYKRSIVIEPVNRGYVIHAGCQTVIFSRDEHGKMMEFFEDLFLKDEAFVIEKWQDATYGDLVQTCERNLADYGDVRIGDPVPGPIRATDPCRPEPVPDGYYDAKATRTQAGDRAHE